MARKERTETLAAPAAGAVPAAIAADMTKSGELVLGDMAREEQTRQLARQLGYEESLNVEALWARMEVRMRRTVEETLEIGRLALLLRARLAHGEFGAELERRNCNRRVVGKFMQAAAKFHGAGEKLAQLPGMTQSKLLELVVLDDADAEALVETGQIPGLPEDAVECMSVSELKAAVRERDARVAAKDKVIEQMSKSANKLREEIAGRKPPTPEFVAEQALRDVDEEALRCAAAIAAGLRGKFVAADDVGAEPALVAQAQAAAVGRVLAAARQLAEDYGIATTGPGAAVEALDATAEDAAVWGAVNAEFDRDRAD